MAQHLGASWHGWVMLTLGDPNLLFGFRFRGVRCFVQSLGSKEFPISAFSSSFGSNEGLGFKKLPFVLRSS